MVEDGANITIADTYECRLLALKWWIYIWPLSILIVKVKIIRNSIAKNR